MESLSVHGVTVPLAPEEVSPVIWQALTSGAYEAKEARSIQRAIKPGDRVLELGSGIGIITSLIAKIPNVTVWAFEANPATVLLARRVIAANNLENVTLSEGILSVGTPQTFTFYVRRDLWMSSTDRDQGPYEAEIALTSMDIDTVVKQNGINVLVMDIEGAERDLLRRARLDGVERIFLELHDHLYGLLGVREITEALSAKGFAYDPRGSQGPCVLFSRDDGAREYDPEVFAPT
ncbi:FkbM family methyltransferase [Methylovirgula sp. 4M-Z18]|uniref:FkbM family methyltransferase n=1 Tax=Methylovirgula sp. 4M-Z18 TaxID=2293567 RepID=UPI000E2EF3A0|nr:FkbM family methyltransferase [Methylovirgula sp. 4M-Z18]RFB81127.1 FkbM family methyltransferase [Methylovirgula sp. 4M-Z18]